MLEGKGHFGGVRLTWRSSADLVGEIKGRGEERLT